MWVLVIGTVVAGGEEFNILAGKSPPFREEMKGKTFKKYLGPY